MRFMFVSGLRVATLALSVALALRATYAQEATLPYENDFETSEGIATGAASELPEWELSGGISTSVSNDSGWGLQALELTSAGSAQLNIDGSMMPSIGWFDFLTKPVVVAEEGLPESIRPYQASVTGFVDLSGEGWIYVVDGDGLGNGEWVSVGSAFALDGQAANSWMRLTYRLDYTNKLWDLYVDGQFVSTDLGFLDNTVDTLNHLRITSDPDDATGLDFLYAGIENPLYLDTSNDGLPDSWLSLQGLDVGINQRNFDYDLDGLTNLEEYRLSTGALNADSDGDGFSDGAEVAIESDPVSADPYIFHNLPYFDDFESWARGPVTTSGAWTVSGDGVLVDAGGAFSGDQFFRVSGESSVVNFLKGSSIGVVWIDHWLKPSAVELPEMIDADVSAAYAFDDLQRLSIYNVNLPVGERWQTADVAGSVSWRRITLKSDYLNQSTDFYVDGARVFSEIPFIRPKPFMTYLDIVGNVDLDDLSVSSSQPLGLDDDWDGLLNDEEPPVGTNPLLFDTDADGAGDLTELQWGMDPLVPDLSLARLSPAGEDDLRWTTEFSQLEGYVSGALNSQRGWLVSGNVEVSGEESMILTESQATAAHVVRQFGTEDERRIWVSFDADLLEGELPETVSPQHAFVIGKKNEQTISIWDPESAAWLASTPLALEPGVNRYSFYLDYLHKTVSAFVNGVLYAQDVSFINTELQHFSHLEILQDPAPGLDTSHPGKEALFDNFEISTVEPSGMDFDGDGLLNSDELANGLDVYDGSDALADIDGDGLDAAQEISLGTRLDLADTDGDGIDDGVEVSLARSPNDNSDSDNDFDGDGMPDLFELNEGLDPFDFVDASLDYDNDALTNLTEYTLGTSLQSTDTDTDQFSDGFEVIYGFDPLSNLSKPRDTDEDGWYDFDEVDAGSDPGNAGSSPGDQIFALDFEQGLLNDQAQAPFYINRYSLKPGFVSNSSAHVTGHLRDGGLKYPIEGNFSRDKGTFSVWVQIRQDSGAFVGDYLWEPIMEVGSWFYKDGLNPEPYLALILHRETKLIGVKTEPGDGGPPSGIQHFQPIDWESHQWHNLAITWEGSALKLYVDGITVFETNTWHGLDEMPSELGFNTTQTLIDDAMVYNRALTASEILDIYEKDTDQDTLPDVWEINSAGGIAILGDALADPDNDGLSNAIEAERRLSPVNADTDEDGLNDFVELYVHLTDPLDPDTDHDGVSDQIEVDLGLNPLVDDSNNDGISDLIAARILALATQNASVALLSSTQGSSHVESKGKIFDVGDKAYATGERAELSYAIELPEAGIYQLRITAHQNQQYVSHENADFETIKESWVYWNDELIDIVSFNQAYGNDSDEAFMLPFSEAGIHALKIFFADGILADGHIIFEKIDLEAYQGDDLDNDGQVDWLRSYAEVANYIEPESLTSYFNPFYVRGSQRGTTLPMANGAPVTRVSGKTWIFPVDLSSENSGLDVVFDDYAITRSVTAQWIPFDLLDANAPSEILVPAGTTVRFKAEDLIGGSEVVTIDIAGGLDSVSIGIGEVLEWSAGLEPQDVLIEATCETGLTRQLIVKVVNADITDNSLNIRTHSNTHKTFEANVESLVLQYDSTLEVLNEDSLESATSLKLNTDEAITQSLDWTIPETGEVVNHAPLNGYRIERGNEGYAKIIETYEDGSFLVEHQINMINLPAEITIEIDIFRAGVVFDDGATFRTIDQSDFDDLGIYHFYMIVPANIGTTTCHRVKSYENGAYLETF